MKSIFVKVPCFFFYHGCQSNSFKLMGPGFVAYQSISTPFQPPFPSWLEKCFCKTVIDRFSLIKLDTFIRPRLFPLSLPDIPMPALHTLENDFICHAYVSDNVCASLSLSISVPFCIKLMPREKTKRIRLFSV